MTTDRAAQQVEKGTRSSALTWAGTARERMRSGDLGVAPVLLGLVVICGVFAGLDLQFLSPRNLSNLSVDIVGIGMIAVGIVFVLLIGEIDLSVGSVAGLTSAIAAVLIVHNGVPEWLAALVALLCGAAVGAIHGFFFAKVGVPAFVVTLAGLLGWNGMMLAVLGPSGSISLDDEGFVAALTSHFFRNAAAAYGLAALSTALFLLAAYQNRRRRRSVEMPYRSLRQIGVRTGAVAVVAFAAAAILNQFRGLPLALLIFLTVLACLDYVLRRTRYGRNVFALGGGVEACRRAGINVARVRISVFMVSGTMAAVGGLFLASRVVSVSQSSGSGILVINVLAAAVIGGVSLFGGRGRTWSALLGVLVIQSIASGMALMGIQAAAQLMITGGVLLAAVVIDSLSRRSQQAYGLA